MYGLGPNLGFNKFNKNKAFGSQYDRGNYYTFDNN